jgi:hypothetical protein
VQVDQVVVKTKPEKRATLSGSALVALEDLEKSLEAKPYNAPLRAALQAMVQRHRARQQD